MPASVIMALVAGAVGGISITAGVGGALVFDFVMSRAIMGFASSLVMGALSKALNKPSTPFVSNAQMVTVRQPAPPRQVIMGESRVAAAWTFAHVDGDGLYTVMTLSGHQVTAIPELYFNDTLVPGDSDATAPTQVAATGTYAGYSAWTKALGDQVDQPFPEFVAETPTWTEPKRQRGCAAVAWKLVAGQGIWTAGVPNFNALVRGVAVYDPRTATTGWTNNVALLAAHYLCNTDYGLSAVYADEIDEDDLIAAADVCDERVSLRERVSAVTADAATNILTLDDEAQTPLTRTGVRFTTTNTLPAPLATGTTYYVVHRGRGRIQLATSDANARAGTVIDITDTGTGTHTLVLWDEPRYVANGSFTTDVMPRAVLVQLGAAMAGRVVDAGGRWHIHAGAYEAPTITLDEDDLAGPISVITALSGREQCNGVKGTFRNPGAHWQPDDFPPVDSDTYLAADQNVRVWKDLDLNAFVTSRSQAQRIAKIELLATRQGLQVEMPCKLTAWSVMTGRTVAVTNTRFGWSGKAFEVIGSRFTAASDGTLGVTLSLRETAAAIYDWATDEESDEDLAPNTDLDFSVGAPGTPAVTSTLVETTSARGYAVEATVAFAQSQRGAAYASYQLEDKLSSASRWTVLPIVNVSTGSVDDVEVVLRDIAAGVYDFRAKAISIDGRSSAYATATGVEINPERARPSAVTGLTVQAMGGMAVLTWDRHPDLDVIHGGRIQFRHSPDTSGAVWGESTSIGQSAPGGVTTWTLPLKRGTYLAKARDAGGRLSLTAASVVTKQASVHQFTTSTTIDEATGNFAGTHSNTIYDGTGDVLKLDGAGSWDDIADLDAIASVDGYGGVEVDGTYGFATAFDLTTVTRFRATASIDVLIVAVNDLIDERTDNMDDWLDFDGTDGAEADAWVEMRTTDDNPAGSPTWTAWQRLDAAEFEARAGQLRARLTTTDPAYNVHISALGATIETRV